LGSALHHGETRLCISLPFSISFTANIARMRPELNRGNTNTRTEGGERVEHLGRKHHHTDRSTPIADLLWHLSKYALSAGAGGAVWWMSHVKGEMR
jgi:hypothetical protein